MKESGGKSKNSFEDDGRQIADMSDVEKNFGFFPRKPVKRRPENEKIDIELTKAERRRLVLSSVITSALISLLFIGAAAAVIALIYFLS